MPSDVQRRSLVSTGQGHERLDQIPHPVRLLSNGPDTLAGGLHVGQSPLVEHPRVTSYSGEGGSELVAGVRGEAALSREGLFSPASGRLVPGEKPVYGGG